MFHQKQRIILEQLYKPLLLCVDKEVKVKVQLSANDREWINLIECNHRWHRLYDAEMMPVLIEYKCIHNLSSASSPLFDSFAKGLQSSDCIWMAVVSYFTWTKSQENLIQASYLFTRLHRRIIDIFRAGSDSAPVRVGKIPNSVFKAGTWPVTTR